MTADLAHRDLIDRHYCDPLDLVWLHTAQQLGIGVRRSSEVFAAWDGQGTLTIGTDETLDPDDCLAQMILHEICHALVEGPEAWQQPDWGLQIGDPRKVWREHACLRVQAALADLYGLRPFFAATTAFRSYYDSLPTDPLQGETDAAAGPARQGYRRAFRPPFDPVLKSALKATRAIADAITMFSPPDSIWAL